MSRFNLPDDLVTFLNEGRQLDYDSEECEAGQVRLNSLEKLELGAIWIDPSDQTVLADSESEKGYYEIPAVSLTTECDGYDPEYILLWLPNEKLFGTWDCDHWILTVFPKATWSDIVEDPAPYVDAQWNPDEDIAEVFQPGPSYDLKPGRPF